jgi:hypothetical protein
MARTKGAHVIQAVKVLRSQRERALAVLAPELHRYLDERILPSTWYPTEDHLALLRALVSLLPGGGVDPWVLLGRGNAQMDLGGLYRRQLKPGDPGRTLEVTQAIWSSAYDSGRVEVAVGGDQSATVKLLDPGFRSRELCRILTGYMMEAVTLAGGRDVQVQHVRCAMTFGIECVWQVQWQPPPASA